MGQLNVGNNFLVIKAVCGESDTKKPDNVSGLKIYEGSYLLFKEIIQYKLVTLYQLPTKAPLLIIRVCVLHYVVY